MLQTPVNVIVDAAAVIAAIVVPIYAFFRFWFFLPAVVVAEDRFGLGRSWTVGGGNVARAIVIFLAIAFSVEIVFGILMSFFMPPFPVITPGHLDPQTIAHWEG